MEDFEIDWVIGQGPAARTMRVPLPHFTLIGATTKAGSVSSPLSSRFGINIHIDFYSPEEIDKVELREVICNFDVYWYPAAEDVLIYPESLFWMTILLFQEKVQMKWNRKQTILLPVC